MNKIGFPKTKRPAFSPPYILFLWFVYGCAPLPGCKQYLKVLVWIFSAQYGPTIKFQILGEISQVLVEDSLGLHKISEKLSRNSFFLKFHVRISDEFGAKRDKFQVTRMSIHPRKKSNSFTHKRTIYSALALMNKKFIDSLVRRMSIHPW